MSWTFTLSFLSLSPPLFPLSLSLSSLAGIAGRTNPLGLSGLSGWCKSHRINLQHFHFHFEYFHWQEFNGCTPCHALLLNSLCTVSCSAWSAFDLSNSPGVAPDKNCSPPPTPLPALLEFLCLFCCFSPASSASLPRFPLYLTALYASADSGMQTSRKEVSALASQATTLATDTSTEWEREGERDKKGVRQADSMCVCVWVCGTCSAIGSAAYPEQGQHKFNWQLCHTLQIYIIIIHADSSVRSIPELKLN